MHSKSNTFSSIEDLKKQNGTHSPSINTIVSAIPDIKINIDACFLSNPYATDLFMKRFESDLLSETRKLRKYLEYYPQQNYFIANKLSKYIKIPKDNILVANGAIEIIEHFMDKIRGKIFIILPTFSSYYEFVNEQTEIFSHVGTLHPEELVKKVIDSKCNNLIIVNPNNPTGNYFDKEQMIYILNNLKHLESILVDESFIHFASTSDPNTISICDRVDNYKNLIVVKSMSKDFGIAGIRCGYAVANKETILKFSEKRFLWNSNGISEYFIGLLEDEKFISEYEVSRVKYIKQFQNFYEDLSSIKNIHVFPSKANFYLINLMNKKSFDFMCWMLIEKGIYVRSMDDKTGFGLEDNTYVRIAGKTGEENRIICESIKEYYLTDLKVSE